MTTSHSAAGHTTEDMARQRLRSLRRARGWSLDELARRSHVGASTISRIETGGRRLALDQLVVLSRALGVSVDDLLAEHDDDVVIRPRRDVVKGVTTWALTRPHDGSGREVVKMRVPRATGRPDPNVHPGRVWFYVVEGTARLFTGGHEHLVEAGQAAEFDTMTPHWFGGHGGPVELISIFDGRGECGHVTASTRRASRPARA